MKSSRCRGLSQSIPTAGVVKSSAQRIFPVRRVVPWRQRWCRKLPLPEMVVKVFSATQEGLATTAELDEAFANFLESPGWRELQTRTARRLCDGSYTLDGDCNKPPPPHLKFAAGLIQKLLGRLQSDHPDTTIVPMQAFLCLYEDGQDACPNHVHDCRQLTLSLGAERFVAVEGERMLMRHGDVMILDGERHGVPADQGRPTQSRVSVNIFFTTGTDQTARPVSVNHRTGSGYQTSGKGRGGKGHSKSRQEVWRQPTAPSAGERRNRRAHSDFRRQRRGPMSHAEEVLSRLLPRTSVFQRMADSPDRLRCMD